MVAVVASLLALVGATPADAAIEDRPAYTFNMQGAASDGQSKWYSVVGPMVNSPNLPVVALQEVGAGPPPSAQGTADQFLSDGQLAALPPDMDYDLPPYPQARTVRHTQWAYGGIAAFINYRDANNPFGEEGLGLGDFNRAPNSWLLAPSMQVVSPDICRPAGPGDTDWPRMAS